MTADRCPRYGVVMIGQGFVDDDWDVDCTVCGGVVADVDRSTALLAAERHVRAASAVGWTPARRRALEAFTTGAHPNGRGYARESNRTDPAGGLVYWQTRAWLDDHGLIERHIATTFRLTALGWTAAIDLGLVNPEAPL